MTLPTLYPTCQKLPCWKPEVTARYGCPAGSHCTFQDCFPEMLVTLRGQKMLSHTNSCNYMEKIWKISKQKKRLGFVEVSQQMLTCNLPSGQIGANLQWHNSAASLCVCLCACSSLWTFSCCFILWLVQLCTQLARFYHTNANMADTGSHHTTTEISMPRIVPWRLVWRQTWTVT